MQSIERKATSMVYDLAQKVPNYAPELHPIWGEALKRYDFDVNSLGDCGDNAMASIVKSEDFSFCGLDRNKCSSKSILVITPPDLALEAGDIIEQPYELCQLPTLNLSYCHAVARWTTPEGFVFEMNASLILEILDFEKFKIEQDGVLQIPIIFFSGRFVNVGRIEVSLASYEQITQMVARASNNWSSQQLSQKERDELLGEYELAVKAAMYPPYGFLIGTYLRVWTSHDAQGC